VDYVSSGTFSTPPEGGSHAVGAGPGRLEVADGEWLDAAVIFRQYHGDLVRLALLLVGDRATAEDVVQDVYTRLCARDRRLDQSRALPYMRAAVVNGCRNVLRRRALARRVATSAPAPWHDTQESAEHTAILAEDRRRVLMALAVSVSNGLFGTSWPAATAHLPAAPHRFYVTISVDTWQTVVRSTATGKVVAVVPVPSLRMTGPVTPQLAAAANGTFYLAASRRGMPGEQIYRFRLSAAGHVTGFARVPGGSLAPGWEADALAASPDGSLVAVGAYYTYGSGRPGQLVVIHTATGAQSIWRGGSPARGYKYFGVASLSWTADGRELAVLGQWCRVSTDPGGESCPRWERLAQLRALDPAGRGGGSVLAGRLLLAQSPRIPFLAQALISPGGSVITAMVLRGKTVGNRQISGSFPQNLSVGQFSVPTGYQFNVLYQRRLGDTSEVSGGVADPLALIADASGHGLILDGGICNLHCTNEFNGWLDGQRFIPLRPAGFAHREAAEAW
jgi:hypothetical protein